MSLSTREIGRGGTMSPGYEVMVTEAEFQTVWGRLVHPASRPQVDFQREWLLAAFMGEKPTGGYRITIDEVRIAGREIRARVIAREPGPSDFVTMVITYPGHWVAVNRPGRSGPYTVIFYDEDGDTLSEREVTF